MRHLFDWFATRFATRLNINLKNGSIDSAHINFATPG